MKVGIVTVSFGLIAVALCFLPIVFDINEGVEGFAVESTSTMAGFLVSIPSLINAAFRTTSRLISRTAALPGVGLSSEEMFIFLIGSSVYAFMYFVPMSVGSKYVIILQSIGNASTIFSFIPLIFYL